MVSLELKNNPLFSDSSLIAYWPFEGNANDAKGTNHGTGSNVSYSTSNGIFGEGVYFNGSNASISVPVSGLGISGAGSRSIGCWFRTSQTSSAYRALLNFPEGGATNTAFLIDICQPEAGLNIGLHFWGNNLNSGINTTQLKLDTWHMAVGTYNGSVARIYIDGVHRANITVSLNTPSSGNFMLGYRVAGGASGYFQGYMDEAFVFNKALSDAEVQFLYDFPLKQYLKERNRFVKTSIPLSL